MTTLTPAQRETVRQIKGKADELVTLFDQLGETDTDIDDVRDAVLDLRDTAQRVAEAPAEE